MQNLPDHKNSSSFTIHPTAIIEENVIIGEHSSVWDHVHIRRDTTLGHHTSVGEKSYIAYNVKIGNFVKINAMVYICTEVVIEDQCMISAGTVFTNDVYPRAMNKELTGLEVSTPTEETLLTLVKKGTTIGANATIGPGIEIGSYAMVGMGSVVTKNIPSQGLAIGNPARLVGYVCVCGPRIIDLSRPPKPGSRIRCHRCMRSYVWRTNALKLMETANHHDEHRN